MAISQRFLTIDNGHMILTGNTLMIYQQNVVNGGPFITTNTALQVPGYPVGTTLNWQENSSMAVLTIPPTATVLYAELTWTSLLIAGAIDYSAFANDPVDFTTPAGLSPVAVQFSDLTNNIATHSADVTALVQAGGSGQYTLGRIAGVNGIESTGITGNAAGWYLSVIVHDPTESSKRDCNPVLPGEGGRYAKSEPHRQQGDSSLCLYGGPRRPRRGNCGAVSNTVYTIVFRYNFSQQITVLIESVALEEAALSE